MKYFVFVISTIATIALFGLPHLVGFFRYGQQYRYLGVEKTDAVAMEETYTYAPRVREIMDKNQIFVRDPYVFENKNKPSPFLGETFPAYLIAFLAKIFDSVENAFIAADFLFPALIFLVIFMFIYRVANNYFAALAGAGVTVFMRDLFLMVPYPRAIGNYLFFIGKPVELVPFSRAFHPEVSFLIFLLFIIFVYLAYAGGKRYALVLGACTLGLLFYTYVFYWTTAVMALIFLAGLSLMHKDAPQLKKLGLMFLIAAFIGSYYFYNMLSFRLLPEAVSFFEKSSKLRSSIIFMPTVRFVIFALTIFFLKKKKNNCDTVFLSFIVAAALLPDMSYYLLGRDLEGIHFVRRVLLPLTSIYIFLLLARQKSTFSKLFFIMMMLSAFIYGLVTQLRSIAKFFPYYRRNIDETRLINFLNTRVPARSVVGSLDPTMNLFLPAVTDNYVYLPMSNMTLSSPTEEVERLIILAKMMKLSDEEVINLFTCQRAYKCVSLGYTVYYFLWDERGEESKKILIKSIQNELEKYKFDEQMMRKYKLDYILVTNYNLPRLVHRMTGRLVFNSKDYKLYSVKL